MSKKKLYRVDVQIYATAYIKASSAAEARTIAKNLKDETLEVVCMDGDLPISGRRYDDPLLPDVSLSPAMTVVGPASDDMVERADD